MSATIEACPHRSLRPAIAAALALSLILGYPGVGVASEEQCLGEGEEASLSADGKRLLFQTRQASGIYNVGIRELATGAVTWLGDGKTHTVHPAWGADGAVVFSHSSVTNTAYEAMKRTVTDGWNIYLWKDGAAKKLTSGHFREYTPSMSPDGKYVYFSSTRNEPVKGRLFSNRSQLFRVAAAGGSEPEHLYGPGNMETSAAVSPHLSPDGTLAVWAQLENFYAPWRIRVAKAGEMSLGVVVTPPDMYAYSPRFSPDGRRIVFCATSFEFPHWGIWVVDPLKDRMIRVADGLNPTFTADGRGIVYDRGNRIYTKRFDRADAAIVRPAGIGAVKTLVSVGEIFSKEATK